MSEGRGPADSAPAPPDGAPRNPLLHAQRRLHAAVVRGVVRVTRLHRLPGPAATVDHTYEVRSPDERDGAPNG